MQRGESAEQSADVAGSEISWFSFYGLHELNVNLLTSNSP